MDSDPEGAGPGGRGPGGRGPGDPEPGGSESGDPGPGGSEPAEPEPGGGREPIEGDLADDGPWRLRDHVGVFSGFMLGLLFLAFLTVLAIAGDSAALSVLVVAVIGTAMIALGVRLHGSR